MKKLNETTFTERELKIFKEIQEYAKKYQTKKVVLFGSRARRTNCEKSDIDLAVYGCSDVTEFYFDIEEEVNTLLMFDVIDMDRKNISKDLLQEIERDGVIIYEEVHLQTLKKAPMEDLDNEFIISGIIDKFYIQFELGWKMLKELLQYEGKAIGATGSPRSIIKEAYNCYDFMREDIWLEMLKNRNDTTHIYDGESAKNLVNVIITDYIPEFQRVLDELKKIYGEILYNI